MSAAVFFNILCWTFKVDVMSVITLFSVFTDSKHFKIFFN